MPNLKCLIPLFVLLSSSAFAAEAKGIDFIHKDWELVCDNTRTCRAAGYQVDGDASDENPAQVSVLLTRHAGPDTPVSVNVKIAENEDSHNVALTMRINDKLIGNVRYDWKNYQGELSEAQVHVLLDALRHVSHIEFVHGKDVYRLSGAGAAAVLLKMDDFQGRVGTPGALMRMGKKAESSVLPPLPAPKLKIAKLDPPQPGDKALAQDKSGALHRALRNTLKNPEDCHLFDDKSRLDVSRLSGGKLLVSAGCWAGARNAGLGYWVIEDHAPFHPLLVSTDANGYQEGMLTAQARGGGAKDDCMGYDDWYWDGSRFVHADSGTTGLCKGFGGGAWDLPTLVNVDSKAWWR